MQPYEKAEKRLTKKQLIWNNFVGGLFWGIGSALGAILLITILGFAISKLNVVPIIGNFVAEVNKVVQEKNSQSPFRFTPPEKQ